MILELLNRLYRQYMIHFNTDENKVKIIIHSYSNEIIILSNKTFNGICIFTIFTKKAQI